MNMNTAAILAKANLEYGTPIRWWEYNMEDYPTIRMEGVSRGSLEEGWERANIYGKGVRVIGVSDSEDALVDYTDIPDEYGDVWHACGINKDAGWSDHWH